MNSFLRNTDKPHKIASIVSALTATGLVLYYIGKISNPSVKSYKKREIGYESIPVPEGEHRYLGHLPRLRDNAAQIVTEWHKQYGPLINVKIGVQNWVFIGNANVAHEIFVTHCASTSGRPLSSFGSGIVGEGGRGILFNDYGIMWKSARTAALNILAPSAVHGFHDALWKESERFVNQLIYKTIAQGEIDPLPYVRLSAINSMLNVVYGASSLKTPEDPLYKKLIYIIENSTKLTGIFEDITTYLPALSFLDVIFGKGRRMKEFWNTESYPTFSQLAVDARERNNDSLTKKIDRIKDDLGLDERNVITILSELLIGGIDNVSAAMLWTFVILCNFPDIQQKLTDEIDSFISSNQRLPTFEDRLQLPYYNAFQKECLRFRPPTFFGIPKKANKDVIYKNYFIPKGTILASNLHTLHFDPNCYYMPEKFLPERFLDNTKTLYASSNGQASNRDQYVFGWGRRICPGIAFAESELFNNVTKLLSRCIIEPVVSPTGKSIYPDLDKFKDAGDVIYPADVKMRFVQRKNRLIV